MSGISRRLSNKEKFFFFEDQLASINMLFVSHLKIGINPLHLQNAVNYIAERQPLLQSKICTDPKDGLVFRPAPSRLIKIQKAHGDNADFLNVVKHHMEERFSIGEAPLFRVVLFTNVDDQTSRIILVLCHVIGDGICGKNFLSDLLRLTIENHLSEYPDLDEIRSLDDLISENTSCEEITATEKKVNSRANQFYAPYKGSQYIPGLLDAHIKRKLEFFQLVVPKDRFSQLKSKIKSNGGSLYSLICALHLSAVYDEFDTVKEIPISINIPVSMRERLTPQVDERYIGLYIAYIMVCAVVGPDKKVLDLSIDFNRKIKESLNEKEYLAGNRKVTEITRSPNENDLRRFQFLLEMTQPYIIISNVGVCDTKEYDSLQHSQYICYGGRNGRRNWMSTVMNSFDDQLYLNFAFNTNAIHIDRAKNIVNKIESLISEVANDRLGHAVSRV